MSLKKIKIDVRGSRGRGRGSRGDRGRGGRNRGSGGRARGGHSGNESNRGNGDHDEARSSQHGQRRQFEYDSNYRQTLSKRLHLVPDWQKYKHQRNLIYPVSLAEDVYNNSAIHSSFQKNGCDADLFTAYSFWETVMKANCTVEDFVELFSPQALVSPTTSHSINVLMLQARAPDFIDHKCRFYESGLEFVAKRNQLLPVEAVAMIYVATRAHDELLAHEQLARNALLYCLLDTVKQQPISAGLMKVLDDVAKNCFPASFAPVFNQHWSKGQIELVRNMVLFLHSQPMLAAKNVPHFALGNDHAAVFINTAGLNDFQLKTLKDYVWLFWQSCQSFQYGVW